jgi:hypothetical protein
MVKAQVIVLALLCLAPFMLPSVRSQSYSTITTQVSSTRVGTITIGTSVVSFPPPSLLLINQSFMVYSTTGTSLGCEATAFTFNGTRGQYVDGSFASNIVIDFYVMSDPSFQSWSKFGTCGRVPAAIEHQQNTTGYRFNVALPDSGTWDIVLINFSNTRNASGFLVAYLTSGTFTSTEQITSTVTYTIPIESAIVQELTTLSPYSLFVIGAIIVVVFIIVLITIMGILKKRRATAAS